MTTTATIEKDVTGETPPTNSDGETAEVRGRTCDDASPPEDVETPVTVPHPPASRPTGAVVIGVGATVVGAFLAGVLVSGQSAAALPIAGLTALLALLPAAVAVATLRKWIENIEVQRQRQTSVAAKSVAAMHDLMEVALVRSHEREAELQKARAKLETTLASREEKLQKQAGQDVEKIRIFFETLLEKHVYRINRELRDRESELEEARRTEARHAAEIENLRTACQATKTAAAAGAIASPGVGAQSFFGGVRARFRDYLQDASVLLRDLASREGAVADDLWRIDRSLASLDRVLDQIVDLERLESGTLQPNYSEICVHRILGDCCDGLRKSARHRGIGLQVNAPTETRPVVADATLLSRAIDEIITNAVCCSEKGGHVSVSAHMELKREDGAEYLVVRVKDSGPGIAEGDRALVFEPFWQGENLTAGSGAGLGLTLARGFIRKLGGELHVESKVERGSSFIISVPARPRS